MKTNDAIQLAARHLSALAGHAFEVLSVAQPAGHEAALNLSKIVSKLSPLVGNLIEFNTVSFLNSKAEFSKYGKWKRQDPGFPDTIFEGIVKPQPGFEIKAWFPLATEITARFKDSQSHFADDHIYVAMLAWLPEFVIYGQPKIIDVVCVSALSVAKARDTHYHNPPDYIILEPEDTTERTRNLQQTNTNGYKFQGSTSEFAEASKVVSSWGAEGTSYSPSVKYQAKLRQLVERFKYRLDTNYAKMDRIAHPAIEAFKTKVYGTKHCGLTISQWSRVMASENDATITHALHQHLKL